MVVVKKGYALVTGASSGLGSDFARQLAARGFSLVLVARRTDRLEALAEEIHDQFGVAVEVVSMDLAESNAPSKLHCELKRKGIEVEVLVNNAGYGLYGLFHQIEWSREQAMLQLDMLALTHLTKLFAGDMIARGKGYILQVASIGAYQATPTYSTYAAAKSFVLQFGEALNFELRKSGVRVSVLSPGVTATEFLAVSGQRPTFYQRLAMMTSEKVVAVGLRAMFRGKPSVVPGLLNKITVFTVRLVPRRVAARISYMLMRDEKGNTGLPIKGMT